MAWGAWPAFNVQEQQIRTGNPREIVMEAPSLRQFGAVCAISGTLITAIFNAMHPDLADPADLVKNAAASSKFVVVHWGLIVGMALMQLGFSACVQTLRHPSENREAAEWGQLGLYMLMVGLCLWITVFSAEVGLKPFADAASTDQIRRDDALALASVVDATATAATIVYWFGGALLGIALLLSKRYPRWFGVVGTVVSGGLTLTVGLPEAFLGAGAWTQRFGFPALAILFLAWTFAMGVLLWRNSEKNVGLSAGNEHAFHNG
jgi:hypothetical protein